MAFTRAELDLIRTALHMASHAYLESFKDQGGIGADARRCAEQRNQISRLLPKVEQNLRAAQGAELVLRHGAAIKFVDGVPQRG